jgi:isoamylase
LRQQRNFLTTLMLSQGVPMLAHGDELGRTQSGNNNVYAQDNPLSWINWNLSEDQAELLEFTGRLIQLRKDHPVFRRRRFFVGDAAHGGRSDLGDIEWFRAEGTPMTDGDWNEGVAGTLMVFLNGDAIPEPDALGRRITDDHFLLMFNAHHEPVDFTLPPEQYGVEWFLHLQTDGLPDAHWKAGSTHTVDSHSVTVLSTSAVPPEQASAAQARAQEASTSIAKKSAEVTRRP